MKKRNTKQVILPLITSFIWGSSFVAQSLGAGKVGGFTFTAARSIPAVLVLGALVLILRRVRHEEKYTPQQKKDMLEGGLVCGIFLTLGTNLQQFGIADTTAGKAGFITALYIVLVPLAGMFLGKKANKRLFLCVLIAVVGLYFLCFTGSEGAMSFGRGDFLVRRVLVAPAQVLGDGAAEQHVLLEHDAHGVPQCGEVVLAHVVTANGHPTRGDVVEPRYELHERGLARARGTQDAHGGACRQVESDV